MTDDESVSFDILPDGDGVKWELYWIISGGSTFSRGRANTRKQAKADALARANEHNSPLFVKEYLRKKRKIPRPARAKIPKIMLFARHKGTEQKSGA